MNSAENITPMKFVIIAAVGLTCATGVFALVGGEVDFENFSNSLIYTNSAHNGPATGLLSGIPGTVNPLIPGSYMFMLFAANTNQTTVDASLSGWDSVAYGVNTATPGLINGNDDSSGPGATLLGPWLSGDPANFLVVGWSTNIGTTWGAASAWWNNGNPISGPSGWFGISGIARDVVVGGGVYPIPTIFGPTPGYEIQGFTLKFYAVPPPPPQITSIAVTGANALVSFLTFSDYAYSVQSTTDLVSGSWSTIASNVHGNGGVMPYLDVGGAAALKRFYRIQNLGVVSAGDSAADPAYANSWTNGSNGGGGFSPWKLTGTGVLGSSSNGFFIASSTNNAAGTSPGIDVSAKSWGIYANGGNLTAAYRGFAKPMNPPLSPGSFHIDMDTGYIDGGNSVGLVLRNGNASSSPSDYNVGARFEFLYLGGDPTNSYKFVDAGGLRNIGVPFTGTGVRLDFYLNGGSAYAVSIVTATTNVIFGGTLAGSGSIDSLAIFNRNAGSGPSHDAFFNALQIIGP